MSRAKREGRRGSGVEKGGTQKSPAETRKGFKRKKEVGVRKNEQGDRREIKNTGGQKQNIAL